MDWSDRIGRRIRLRDLHILLAVAQCGSMAKAAQFLAISQPVISKVVADLEAVLGVRLLERDRHGARPTIYGAALLKRSAVAFDELQQGVKDIACMLDPAAGHLRIGGADPIVAGLFPAVIVRLRRIYPSLSFHVVIASTASEQKLALRERQVDLIVGRLSPDFADDDMEVCRLFDEPLLVAAAKSSHWSRRRKISLAELAGEAWVLPRPDTFPGAMAIKAFSAEGLSTPANAIICGHTHMISAMLATGQYLAFYPGSLMRLSADRLAIAPLSIKLRAPVSSVGMVTVKNRTISPVSRLFLNMTQQIVKSLGLSAPA